MQTGQITLLSPDLFASMATGAPANAEAVAQSTDFSAFLLSLLSMESMPVDPEAPTGDNPEQVPGEQAVIPEIQFGPGTLDAGVMLDQMGNSTFRTLLDYNNIENHNSGPIDANAPLDAAKLRKEYLAGLYTDDALVSALNQDAQSVVNLTGLSGTVAGCAAEMADSIDADPGSMAAAILPAQIDSPLSEVLPFANIDKTVAGQSAEQRLVDAGNFGTSNLTLESLVASGFVTGTTANELAVHADRPSANSAGNIAAQGTMNSHDQQYARTLYQDFSGRLTTTQPAESLPVQSAGTGLEQTGVTSREIESLFPEVKVEALRVSTEPKNAPAGEQRAESAAPKVATPIADSPQTRSASLAALQAEVTAAGETDGKTATAPSPANSTSGRVAESQKGPNTPLVYESKEGKGDDLSRKDGQSLAADKLMKQAGTISGKAEILSGLTETDAKIATTGSLNANPLGKGINFAPSSDGTPQVRYTIDPESLQQPIKMPTEIQLKIQPEELGIVKLQLRMVDNHLNARVIVQTPAARVAVEGSLVELQRNLADAGLVIDRFDVGLGHTSATMAANPDANPQRRRYAFRPKTNRRYEEIAGIRKTEIPSLDRMINAAALNDYGRLNMVA